MVTCDNFSFITRHYLVTIGWTHTSLETGLWHVWLKRVATNNYEATSLGSYHWKFAPLQRRKPSLPDESNHYGTEQESLKQERFVQME